MTTENTVDTNELNSVPPTAEAKQADDTPKVEVKEGKVYVNGVRTYTRDETNKIASNAKIEAEKSLLKELDVDNLDQVKQVYLCLIL